MDVGRVYGRVFIRSQIYPNIKNWPLFFLLFNVRIGITSRGKGEKHFEIFFLSNFSPS